MLPIIIVALTITATLATECTCPEDYQKSANAHSCRIFLERLPCNTTIPKCDCPKDHTATPSRQFGYVCTKQHLQTQCQNREELNNFIAKIVNDSTWNGPPESCKCLEHFTVSKNWNTVLCVNPHSYWKEIPCGFAAPPACKCRDGQIYGVTEDSKKLAYNSFYGCRNEMGKVGSCLNEEEIKKYFDDLLRLLQH